MPSPRVRTLTGKEIELDIESDYKVSKIKERVEEKEGIPPAQQRLIFGGKQMYVAAHLPNYGQWRGRLGADEDTGTMTRRRPTTISRVGLHCIWCLR